jgi:D-aminopeptidase
MSQAAKPRARDLGIRFDGTPGNWNALTDVAGIEVGYTTLRQGEGELVVGQGPICTGVTAILPRGKATQPRPVWAGQYDLNGNGEMTGTHWIRDAGYFLGPLCLTNTHSVGIAHHAAVGWMTRQYRDFFQDHHGWAMPVVAETYDGLTNDICGRHITEAHVLAAIEGAASGPLKEGNVGGGTGMQTYEFKGGTGTSSRVVPVDDRRYTVAALVQSNFGVRSECTLRGVPVGQLLPDNAVLTELSGHEHGSIIVVIATDAPLLPIQLQRLAKRGALGIGRTGTSGGHYSGDIMLAFSVANDFYMPTIGEEQPGSFHIECLNDAHIDLLHAAAVQAVEESVVNAMIAAESVATVKPAGYVLEAIDHEALCRVMREYSPAALQ